MGSQSVFEGVAKLPEGAGSRSQTILGVLAGCLLAHEGGEEENMGGCFFLFLFCLFVFSIKVEKRF